MTNSYELNIEEQENDYPRWGMQQPLLLCGGRQSSCPHFPFSKLGRLMNPFVLFKHKVEAGTVLIFYPYNYITQYFLYRSSRVSKFLLVEYLRDSCGLTMLFLSVCSFQEWMLSLPQSTSTGRMSKASGGGLSLEAAVPLSHCLFHSV